MCADWRRPEPCGVFKTTLISPSAEQAIIQKVLHVYDIWITFSCGFEGNDHTYDFQTHDKITPPKLKVILEDNIISFTIINSWKILTLVRPDDLDVRLR